MTEIYEQAKHSLQGEDFSSFNYLFAVNKLLSNPVSYDLGRDLIVRAVFRAHHNFEKYGEKIRFVPVSQKGVHQPDTG